MSWARVAGIGSTLIAGAVIAAGVRLTSVDLERAFAEAALEIRQATGLEVASAGNFGLKLAWPPRAVGYDVSIANPSWTTRPSLATARSVEAELDPLPFLAGNVRVTRVLFNGLDLVLERDRRGGMNWAFGPVEDRRPLPDEWTLITSSIAELAVGDGRVAFIDHATNERHAFEVDHLVARAGDEARPVEFEADVRINAAFLALAGTLGSLQEMRSGRPFGIDVKASGAGAAIAVNGEVEWPTGGSAPAATLAATIAGTDFGALASALGAPFPSIGPYSLSARLGVDPTGYRVSDLRLQLGRSDISGEVFIRRHNEPGRLVATLTSTLVDLTELRAVVTNGSAAPLFEAFSEAIAAAQISFAGARVVGVGFELDRVTAEATLGDEQSTADSSALGGGKADGSGPAGGAAGTVLVSAEGGALEADLARRLLTDQAMLLVADSGDAIEFDCMAGRIAWNTDDPLAAALIIDGPSARISGAGRIDLAAQTIDMRFTPLAKRPDLAERMAPVRARGPLAKLDLVAEPVRAAESADQDASSGANSCVGQIDLATETDGAGARPTALRTEKKVSTDGATQTGKKRSTAPRFRNFFEVIGDDIDHFLRSTGESTRPTPISKRGSKGLR